METIKTNWKRYVASTIVTFVATFLLVAAPEFLDGNFVWTKASVVGVLLAAVRLGVKAVWEILRPLLLSLLGKK